MHSLNMPTWLPGRSLYKFIDLDPRRAALLAIDLQHGFISPGQPFAVPGGHGQSILPNIKRMADALAEAGGLVVYTRHTVADEGPEAVAGWQSVARLDEICRPGMASHGLAHNVSVGREAIVIDKYRYSALTYNSSVLPTLLEQHGIDTVIVAGVVTNCCVESTARDASMSGLRSFVISDASAAMSDEEHNAALLNLGLMFADVRTTNEMMALLERAPD